MKWNLMWVCWWSFLVGTFATDRLWTWWCLVAAFMALWNAYDVMHHPRVRRIPNQFLRGWRSSKL